MNEKENFAINCFFDTIGNTITKKINCVFSTVNDNDIKITLNLGNNNKIINPTENDLIRNKLKPIVGTLTEKVNKQILPITNARISFVLDNVVISKSDTEYNGDTSVMDYCVTNSIGQYTVFLTPAFYGIRIDNGKKNNYLLNQKIDNGLIHEYYFTIQGLVKEKYEDIVVFNKTDMNLIYGKVISQNDIPIQNAEIVISSGENIITYIKTDKDGKYAFGLKNGIYDVRLRSENQPVKIIKNWEFKDGVGFINSLNDKSNLYIRNSWIYI